MHTEESDRENRRPLVASPLRRGFTLVEMLVVIVIISALAALLIPAVMIAVARARQSAIAFEVANIAKSLEQYKLQFGEYPPDFSSAAVLTGPARINEAKRLIDTHLVSTMRRRDSSLNGDYPLGDDNMVDLDVLAKLDPSNALFFWLRGFSSDPQYPISGGASERRCLISTWGGR